MGEEDSCLQPRSCSQWSKVAFIERLKLQPIRSKAFQRRNKTPLSGRSLFSKQTHLSFAKIPYADIRACDTRQATTGRSQIAAGVGGMDASLPRRRADAQCCQTEHVCMIVKYLPGITARISAVRAGDLAVTLHCCIHPFVGIKDLPRHRLDESAVEQRDFGFQNHKDFLPLSITHRLPISR